ncbi:type II toxin-antitoxin system VapC family toxin [Roseburia sp. 1XD42-69]|uniref:type II toxin-antitoxin system VapC family toxin n=1 Tax=Roseburia sp. 1XD42-69 TaxID=2320088 RepID=UPI000EA26F38|nr:PIN domain-containing protein [Roseburia sp. 1XD42-69]RKJ59853.1 PIN domain-containing protein [Roseburia sp. 1XD42-69]
MTDFKKVFIDTAPFIYFLENSSRYMESIGKFFTKCTKENIQIVTSTLTIEEYLVLPYSNGKVEYVDNFKRFIEYMNIEVVDIDSNIAEQGAKIRGQYKNFKAMDALQIATAIVKECDMFFTNDKQLRQEKELPCMTMEDI